MHNRLSRIKELAVGTAYEGAKFGIFFLEKVMQLAVCFLDIYERLREYVCCCSDGEVGESGRHDYGGMVNTSLCVGKDCVHLLRAFVFLNGGGDGIALEDLAH